jgi:polynucleotide 5'-kinase involved in rRNA processing
MAKRVLDKNPFDALRKAAKISKTIKKEREEMEPIWIPIQLSALNSTHNKRITLVRLEENERLTLQGKYHLGCVVGAIDVLGFEINGETNWPNDLSSLHFYPVYSPSSHSLLSIKSIELDPNVSTMAGNLTDQDRTDILQLMEKLPTKNGTVVAIKILEDHLEGVESIMPIFRNLFGVNHEKDVPQYFTVSTEQNFTQFSKKQEKQLDRIFDCSGNPPIVCVVGNVNSGKSTITRFIVNRSLKRYQKVAYLDCDVGQPELGVQGQVGIHIVETPLLGPPFTHTQIPYIAYHLGFVSPKAMPSEYSKALHKLMEEYRLQLSHLPLIVNTCGWTKGVGYDLLSHFVATLEPSDLVLLDHQEQHRNLLFPNLPASVRQHSFSCVRDDQIQKIKLNSADQRALHLCSYFFQNHHIWDFSTCLGDKQPYRVHWSQFKILFLGEEVPFSQALVALNGSVVGLSVDKTVYHNQQPNKSLAFVPCNSEIIHHCLGLGIIRGIDTQSECFYILTPLPADMLTGVNLLIRGTLELPTALYSNGFGRAHVPYTTFMVAEGIGSAALKNRHLGRRKMNT